jgi:hypothetical protein
METFFVFKAPDLVRVSCESVHAVLLSNRLPGEQLMVKDAAWDLRSVLTQPKTEPAE